MGKLSILAVVLAVALGPALAAAQEPGCRQHFQQAICLSDGSSERPQQCVIPAAQDMAPLRDAVAALMAAYDVAPAPIKRQLCKVKQFFIDPGARGSIWAWWDPPNGDNPALVYLGIDKAVMDQAAPIASYQNKDGGNYFKNWPTNSAPSPVPANIPWFTSADPNTFTMTLVKLLAHEVGHLVLAQQGIYPQSCASPCTLTAFPAISWSQWVVPGTGYPWQAPWGEARDTQAKTYLNTLIYAHPDLLTPSGQKTAADVFAYAYGQQNPEGSNWNTSFLSLFAMTTPIEDFADSVAYYALAHSMTSLVLSIPAGTYPAQTVDVVKQILSPNSTFAPKRALLDAIWNTGLEPSWPKAIAAHSVSAH